MKTDTGEIVTVIETGSTPLFTPTMGRTQRLRSLKQWCLNDGRNVVPLDISDALKIEETGEILREINLP